MQYLANFNSDAVEQTATINQPQCSPRMLYAGHFHTQPGYVTVRDQGTQDWLLFFTLQGQGRIAHLDGVLETTSGECVILPPGVRHDYRIAHGCDLWEFYWTHFIPWPHWLKILSWPKRYRGINFLAVGDDQTRARISLSLQRMVTSMSAPLDDAEFFAMNALEEALLWMQNAVPKKNARQLDARILSAMDYLCSRITETITLEEIGTHSGLSSSRLSHLFRDQVGLSPMQYVEQQRIRKARDLLEISAFTISQIAYQIGYESPLYFSRRFSKAMGVSPKEYRQVHGKR